MPFHPFELTNTQTGKAEKRAGISWREAERRNKGLIAGHAPKRWIPVQAES